MDVLDSLDLDTTDKKSLRVRSWYLYEQYKSLEKHQLDAAQKLKNRSYQDRILRQELSERRARRKLYDQFGLCQSESSIQKTISNHTAHAPTLSASTDDFFESFSEQDDEHVTREMEFDHNEAMTPNKSSMEDFKSVQEQKDNVSYSDSVTSVVENVTTTDYDDNKYNSECNDYLEYPTNVVQNFVPSLDESNEYEYAGDNKITPVVIAQDINKQLDSVREDIQCLEDITKLELGSAEEDLQCLEDTIKLDDESSDNVSESLHDDDLKPKIQNDDKKHNNEYNHVITMWSRLVSFAYQLIQLNHGNCYCDYSSQLLTAVLACDILRRGVSRMSVRCINHVRKACASAASINHQVFRLSDELAWVTKILVGLVLVYKPYVSPISFVTDDNHSDTYYNTTKMKKSVQSRKSRKEIANKPYRRMNRHNNSSRLTHKNYSENCWNSCLRRTLVENGSKSKYPRRASEPWRSVVKNPYKGELSSSNSSIWSQISKENMSRHMFKGCTCCKNAVNPMLKIARYIDSILKDINDV